MTVEDTYDYVVIGSGVGGLCTAALLASTGYRVCVLERHVVPGGYEHSFTKGGYTFCAQLHYLWNCGRDDEFGLLLRYLGLQDKVTFSMLDADGFDRLNFPSFKYDIVNGFDRNIELISKKFPEHRASITRYFKLITRLNREMLRLPIGFDAWSLARHALSYPNVLRYRNWTTEDLFDSLRLPPEVRSILAGQSGDLLLPPGRASLLVQAALACGYDSGAYVPVKGYQHLFSSLTGFIEKQRSCKILLGHWVTSLQHTGGRVTAATTRKGKVIRGRHFLYNGDPAMLRGLLGTALPGWFEKRLHYEFSPSSFTIYLGLKGIDLTRHGFGNWNVWHYAHDSISRCYEDQLDHGMMDNPSMFLSTPTLHQKGGSYDPAGLSSTGRVHSLHIRILRQGQSRKSHGISRRKGARHRADSATDRAALYPFNTEAHRTDGRRDA